MTREEILAMKPGAELDKLVEEIIFGRTFPSVPEMEEYAKEVWKSQPNCINFLLGFSASMEEGKFIWNYHLRPFSIDISAAWNVAKTFKIKGYLFELKNLVGGKYEFTLIDWGGKCSIYKGQGGGASEAICKAALLAVMEDKP